MLTEIKVSCIRDHRICNLAAPDVALIPSSVCYCLTVPTNGRSSVHVQGTARPILKWIEPYIRIPVRRFRNTLLAEPMSIEQWVGIDER